MAAHQINGEMRKFISLKSKERCSSFDLLRKIKSMSSEKFVCILKNSAADVMKGETHTFVCYLPVNLSNVKNPPVTRLGPVVSFPQDNAWLDFLL